jgi:hypothetical protein
MSALGRVFPLALAIVALAGCSGIRVGADWDRKTDFARYKTYDWLPVIEEEFALDPRLDVSLLSRRVRTAADRELQAMGFALDANQPDFLVRWHAASRTRLQATAMDRGYARGRGGWGYGTRTDVHIREYEQGALILDFVDRETNVLFWTGFAEAEIRFSASSDRRRKRINEAVVKLLAQFPPKG